MYDEHSVIFRGDYLTCSACEKIIWFAKDGARYFYYRDIRAAYQKHARNCLGLRKIIVLERRKAEAERLISEHLLPYFKKSGYI